MGENLHGKINLLYNRKTVNTKDSHATVVSAINLSKPVTYMYGTQFQKMSTYYVHMGCFVDENELLARGLEKLANSSFSQSYQKIARFRTII